MNVAKSVISLNLPLSDEENNYKLGMSVHEYNYEPIEGAVRAVKLLKTKGKVVIFTIGNRADQLRKLIMLGLHTIVDAVETSDMKDESLFRMLKMKYPSDIYYMFGDSINRDIEPAKKANIDYVYHVTKEHSLDYHVSCLLKNDM